jgi:hypothetical protein
MGPKASIKSLSKRSKSSAAVHFIPDSGDVSGLLTAKEIARAADFQIAHGDAEAGAQLAEFFDGFEAFGCLAQDGTIGGQEQITIGAVA